MSVQFSGKSTKERRGQKVFIIGSFTRHKDASKVSPEFCDLDLRSSTTELKFLSQH